MADRVILEDEQALEERCTVWDLAPTLHLHQRTMFVLAHLILQALQLLQPVDHRAIGLQGSAHWQGVNEETHHRFYALDIPGASSKGRTEDNILLASGAS